MTSLHADEAFLGHYQLSHDPFAPRVPGFKFFPAQRKPVLGQLHHLARYSQLLLVVTGPLGSGKTLLRQALVASTNKQSVQSVVVSARGAGDAAGVLRQVAQALDVASAEPNAILKQVVQLGLTGQEVYLLVDDAEQLDESALEALLALAAGTPEGRPHVFLFGESSLIAALEQISGEQELFHVIELQPYEEEETREYLAQRLEGAGQGIELFSAQQISDIHESSDGWPGTINQVARDAMIEAMIASRSAVKRPKMGFTMPKKHVLAISAVVVVAVAAAWLIPGRNKAPTTAGAPTEQAQLPLGKPTPNVEFANSGQPTNLPMVGQPGDARPARRSSRRYLRRRRRRASGRLQRHTADRDHHRAACGRASGSAGGKANAGADACAYGRDRQAGARRQAGRASACRQASSAPAPAAKPAEKPVTVAKAGATGSSWYASQPSGNFVVQILGTSSEANAQTFVKEQGGEYRYFKKVLNGKPLYVITYGSFSSRAAADTAIKALPAKVQAGKPWPRTVASVQQELAATR